MKLHQKVELDALDQAIMRRAGERWAWAQCGHDAPNGVPSRHKRIAAALNVSPHRIAGWEYGKRRVPVEWFRRWCALVGVDVTPDGLTMLPE